MLLPPYQANRYTQNHIPLNHRGNFHRPPQNLGGFQQLIQRFTNQRSSGSPLTTNGVSSLSNILNNVQQVLRLVQSAAPLIEEYGPMIKNLPTMYKMYQAMKDIGSEEEGEDGESGQIEREQASTTEKKIKEPELRNREASTVEDKGQGRLGESIPKLYIS